MRLANGVASYAMNYYRELRNRGIHFDFLVVNDVGSPFYKEIEDNGDKVYLLPSYAKHPVKCAKYLKQLFTINNYDILHCNVMNSGALVMMMAKKSVPVRILHSHATQVGDKKWKQYRNKIFSGLSLHFATDYFSCSHLAGDFIFGKDNYYVIRNAIDISKYSYSQEIRNSIRRDNNCQNLLIIMTVGRITRQKNPFFIVEVVSELKKRREDFQLWWFGNGELEEQVKNYAEKKGVLSHIRFWGTSDCVNQYYSAADIFILPSFYEGLPVVGIEAQASGLPVIYSNTITDEARLTDNVIFLPIDNADDWAKELEQCGEINRDVNIEDSFSDYTIEVQSLKMENLYNILINKGKKDIN